MANFHSGIWITFIPLIIEFSVGYLDNFDSIFPLESTNELSSPQIDLREFVTSCGYDSPPSLHLYTEEEGGSRFAFAHPLARPSGSAWAEGCLRAPLFGAFLRGLPSSCQNFRHASPSATPSAPYVLCRSQTHDIGFIQSERLASGSRPSRGFDTRNDKFHSPTLASAGLF